MEKNNTSIITIVGFLAAIIGIVVFLSGKPFLKNWLGEEEKEKPLNVYHFNIENLTKEKIIEDIGFEENGRVDMVLQILPPQAFTDQKGDWYYVGDKHLSSCLYNMGYIGKRESVSFPGSHELVLYSDLLPYMRNDNTSGYVWINLGSASATIGDIPQAAPNSEGKVIFDIPIRYQFKLNPLGQCFGEFHGKRGSYGNSKNVTVTARYEAVNGTWKCTNLGDVKGGIYTKKWFEVGPAGDGTTSKYDPENYIVETIPLNERINKYWFIGDWDCDYDKFIDIRMKGRKFQVDYWDAEGSEPYKTEIGTFKNGTLYLNNDRESYLKIKDFMTLEWGYGKTPDGTLFDLSKATRLTWPVKL